MMGIYDYNWFLGFDYSYPYRYYKFKIRDHVFVEHHLEVYRTVDEGFIKQYLPDYKYIVSIKGKNVDVIAKENEIREFKPPVFKIGETVFFALHTGKVIDITPMLGFHLYKVRFENGIEGSLPGFLLKNKSKVESYRRRYREAINKRRDPDLEREADEVIDKIGFVIDDINFNSESHSLTDIYRIHSKEYDYRSSRMIYEFGIDKLKRAIGTILDRMFPLKNIRCSIKLDWDKPFWTDEKVPVVNIDMRYKLASGSPDEIIYWKELSGNSNFNKDTNYYFEEYFK